MLYPGSSESSVDQLSLDIDSGELTALLGPSGCGKTTTMKMIAGLLQPTAGDILFDGRSILKDKPEHRGAVMVFQSNLLFPYMNVADNVGFGLKMRKASAAEIRQRTAAMLAMVKLPDMGNRKPGELSGGQQQRVALARALIVQPRVLLLDEPLASLDAHLRQEMRDLIRSLQQELGITTVVVTHDQEEAVVLADRIALMLDGQLKQYDQPEAFYKRPVDEATARFFGGKNFIAGDAADGVVDTSFGRLALQDSTHKGACTVTFRPENVSIARNLDAPNTISAELAEKTYLGTQTRLRLIVGDDHIEALVNPGDVERCEKGQVLNIMIAPDALWLI